MPSERCLAKGGIERIGSETAPWKLEITGEEPVTGTSHFSDHAEAIAHVGEFLSGRVLENFQELKAVGFKTVMAKDVSGTQFLTEDVLKAMEELNAVVPAHNPPYIAAVRAFNVLAPGIPCIGTFETAFYDHVPEYNSRFPIPLEWEQKFGIRRYGFHGASHRFVTERAAELAGSKEQRIISCHLGGSSSIAAVKNGVAINSSWGMTPQSGLPQNNRVGDFDVFALIHLLRNCNMTLDEVESALSKDSGLKGMSGLSSGDIRDLLKAVEENNQNAQIALDVFVAQIRKYIGQFLMELNGADQLVLTGGIAENNPLLRTRICQDLDFCGIHLDPERNAKTGAEEALISTPESKVQIRVIPTNEEIIIARNACNLLNATASLPQPQHVC